MMTQTKWLPYALLSLAACGTSSSDTNPAPTDAGTTFYLTDASKDASTELRMYVNTKDTLYAFGPESGGLEKIGTANCNLMDIAVSNSGQLYGLVMGTEQQNTQQSAIVTLTPASGTVTCGTPLSVPGSASPKDSVQLLGIAFGKLQSTGANEQLFAVGSSPHIYVVSLTTGSLGDVGSVIDNEYGTDTTNGTYNDISVLTNGASPVAFLISTAVSFSASAPGGARNVPSRLWELDTPSMKAGTKQIAKAQGRHIVGGAGCEAPTDNLVRGLVAYNDKFYAVAGDAIIEIKAKDATACVVKHIPGEILLGAAITSEAPYKVPN